MHYDWVKMLDCYEIYRRVRAGSRPNTKLHSFHRQGQGQGRQRQHGVLQLRAAADVGGSPVTGRHRG